MAFREEWMLWNVFGWSTLKFGVELWPWQRFEWAEKVEANYIEANNKLKSIEEKSVVLRENKARFEATIEGIDQRKMDLFVLFSCKGS